MVLLLALFGFAVELLDFEPRRGSVIRLALFEQPQVPGQLVIGTWLVESAGLIALFLLTRGRFGAWWLDGLVAGWLGWIFRGPLLVITLVVAARQPQEPWWTLAFGWWALYSVCGLSLALLARRSGLNPWMPLPPAEVAEAVGKPDSDSETERLAAETDESETDQSKMESEAPTEDLSPKEDRPKPDRSQPDGSQSAASSEAAETEAVSAAESADVAPIQDDRAENQHSEIDASHDESRGPAEEPAGDRRS